VVKLFRLTVNIGLFVRLIFLLTLLLIANKSLAIGIIYDTQVTVSQSPLKLTPGQQLTLTIAVTYPKDGEIFFDVNQVNWQAFTLINHQKSAVKWIPNFINPDRSTGSWQVEYIIDLIVPLAGEYQLPNMILHRYLGQQHQKQVVQTPKIVVTSSFPTSTLNKQLQPIEAIHLLNEEESKQTSLLFLTAFLAILLLVFRLLKGQKSTNNQSKHGKNTAIKAAAQTPAQLIVRANESNDCHWEGLRQCMLVHLGFDPLAERINDEDLALSNHYISARFAKTSKATFIALCKQCQDTTNLTDDHANSGSDNAQF